jgi:SHS2 domain-containing protein
MSYEILEHTADAKFKSWGETMEEAFKEAVKAFSEITGGEGGQHRHEIKTESENHEALLFDFLDELIFLQDTENVVISNAKNLEIKEKGKEPSKKYKLTATVWTNPITGAMSPLDIKAPTYSEMEVDYKKGKGWVLTAVLDI